MSNRLYSRQAERKLKESNKGKLLTVMYFICICDITFFMTSEGHGDPAIIPAIYISITYPLLLQLHLQYLKEKSSYSCYLSTETILCPIWILMIAMCLLFFRFSFLFLGLSKTHIANEVAEVI